MPAGLNILFLSLEKGHRHFRGFLYLGIGNKIYYVHMHIINLKNKNVKNCFAPAVYLPFRTVKINHED